jgi:hypothetical protein
MTATLTKPRLVNPMLLSAPLARIAAPGHELVDLNELEIFTRIIGETTPGGYSTEYDHAVTQTSDGTDLNALWAEFQATLQIFNQRRNTLVSMLTFDVDQPVERVPQVGTVDFEDASEFGVPRSVRLAQSYFSLGYDFRDYDLAWRYTWKFLRDSDVREVQAQHNATLEGYNRLVFRRVMEAIFDNRNRLATIKDQNVNVYSLYNGDGTVPPAYKGTTFAGSHSHYLVSNGVLDVSRVHPDSEDLDTMKTKIAEHGYGSEQGTTFVLLANSVDMADIRTFKTGVTNFNGAVAKYDFIPNANSPTLITPNATGLIGSQPPTSFGGLPVVGSYNNILLIEEDYIPVGYMLMFGTGGTGNLKNLVGIRQHANAAYRGLRIIPGNQQGYPLVESFYSVGFGTGIRQRAGGVVMQLKASGTYDIPAQYTRGGGNG